MGPLKAQSTNSPKNKSEAENTVLMGELRKESGIPLQTSEPNPKLEAALTRLEEGFRHSRGG
jgi:hypothetical protein